MFLYRNIYISAVENNSYINIYEMHIGFLVGYSLFSYKIL